MACDFRYVRRVEFADTDMAGLVHFSNYFKFMEAAECAFHRSLGLTIQPPAAEGSVHWPRVEASCRFTAPLAFEDEVELHLIVREIKPKAVTYDCVFRKLVDGKPGPEVARGRVTTVTVARQPDGGLKAVPVPAEVAAKLEPAPPALLD